MFWLETSCMLCAPLAFIVRKTTLPPFCWSKLASAPARSSPLAMTSFFTMVVGPARCAMSGLFR